jgi:hypothetical protein
VCDADLFTILAGGVHVGGKVVRVAGAREKHEHDMGDKEEVLR